MKVRLPGGSARAGVVDLKRGSGEQDTVCNNGLAE